MAQPILWFNPEFQRMEALYPYHGALFTFWELNRIYYEQLEQPRATQKWAATDLRQKLHT